MLEFLWEESGEIDHNTWALGDEEGQGTLCQ